MSVSMISPLRFYFGWLTRLFGPPEHLPAVLSALASSGKQTVGQMHSGWKNRLFPGVLFPGECLTFAAVSSLATEGSGGQ